MDKDLCFLQQQYIHLRDDYHSITFGEAEEADIM